MWRSRRRIWKNPVNGREKVERQGKYSSVSSSAGRREFEEIQGVYQSVWRTIEKGRLLADHYSITSVYYNRIYKWTEGYHCFKSG